MEKNSKNYRDNLKKDNAVLANLEANTPPGSPAPANTNEVSGHPSNSRLSSGKKIEDKIETNCLKKLKILN